jgi:hypothetical protein
MCRETEFGQNMFYCILCIREQVIIKKLVKQIYLAGIVIVWHVYGTGFLENMRGINIINRINNKI